MITRARISAVRASGVRRLFEDGTCERFCPRCRAYSSKYGTCFELGSIFPLLSGLDVTKLEPNGSMTKQEHRYPLSPVLPLTNEP